MVEIVIRIGMLLANEKTRNFIIGAVVGLVAFTLLMVTLIFNFFILFFIGSDDGSYYYPMEHYQTINSPFDPSRVHPITGQVATHNGVDMPSPQGTEVFSARAGTVSRVWSNAVEGNAVEIFHGDETYTRYKHMFQQLVAEGDEIMARDLIGLCGTTGDSTGPHVHFEIKISGSYIDPQPLLTEWPDEDSGVYPDVSE